MPLYKSTTHLKLIKAFSKLHAEAHLGRQAHPTIKAVTIDELSEAYKAGVEIEDATTSSEASGKGKPGPKAKGAEVPPVQAGNKGPEAPKTQHKPIAGTVKPGATSEEE